MELTKQDKSTSVGGSALHEGGEPLGQSLVQSSGTLYAPEPLHPAGWWSSVCKKAIYKQYNSLANSMKTRHGNEIVKCRGAGPWSMCVSKAPAPLTCCGAPASSWMVELRMHGHEHKNKSNELYHRGRPASFDGRPPCDSELGLCDSQHPAMLGVAKV